MRLVGNIVESGTFITAEIGEIEPVIVFPAVGNAGHHAVHFGAVNDSIGVGIGTCAVLERFGNALGAVGNANDHGCNFTAQ